MSSFYTAHIPGVSIAPPFIANRQPLLQALSFRFVPLQIARLPKKYLSAGGISAQGSAMGKTTAIGERDYILIASLARRDSPAIEEGQPAF